jgi:hypothetical protein
MLDEDREDKGGRSTTVTAPSPEDTSVPSAQDRGSPSNSPPRVTPVLSDDHAARLLASLAAQGGVPGLGRKDLDRLTALSKAHTARVLADPWTTFRPSHSRIWQRVRTAIPVLRHRPVGVRRAQDHRDDRYGSSALKIIPDANYVLQRGRLELQRLRPVERGKVCRFGAWNVEFAGREKACHLLDLWEAVGAVFPVLGFEEADRDFFDVVARHTGMTPCVGTPNSRGQGNGLLVHPEYRVREWLEIDDTVGIGGIPDLRPAVSAVVELGDEEVVFTDIHNKSMRGGEEETRPVRTESNGRLGDRLKREWGNLPHVVMGDDNCHLEIEDRHPEINPLLTILGLVLWPCNDVTATHRTGARLDGFKVSQCLVSRLSDYCVLFGDAFWGDPKIQDGVSDHGEPCGCLALC